MEIAPDAGDEGTGAGVAVSEQEGAAQTIGIEAKRYREEKYMEKVLREVSLELALYRVPGHCK